MTISALLGDSTNHRRFSTFLLGLLLLGTAHRAPAFNELTLGAGEFCLHRATAPVGPESSDYRNYAPDRKVDILHLALDVTPDFKQRTVAGEATLSFKPIATALDELRLDAVDLAVTTITGTEKIRAWQVTDSAIIITFDQPVAAGKEAKVTIRYSAEPRLGIYFRTPEMGYKAGETHLFSQGESIEARHWYPGFDAPNEKFTSEITCHAPDGMTVLSNGKLMSSTKEASGMVAVRWLQDKPHVNYLLTLVVGYFKKVEDKYRGIPLEFWVPPADLAEAPESFKDTKAAMEFFEKDIGVPYAWAKYGQVCIRDFHWGGMENTSMTTLTDRTLHRADTENLADSEGLVAHELAHQWFGDLVTCKDWSHAWLNEGFATYYAHLFTGHKNGRETMLFGLYGDLKGLTGRPDDTQPIVSRKFKEPEDRFRQYGYLIYPKGGWVLHMLRSQLGDELYRKCIKTYLERHQFDIVVTEDLRAVVEELSGRSYDQFFDQWLYHAHHPELEVTYSWDEKAKLAKVSVKQTQKISEDVALFNFPLTLRFKSKAGTVNHTVKVTEKEEDFYCALPEAPQIVRIDPELTLLAKINFKLPNPLLNAQLEDKSDMLGRVLAVEQLGTRKDHEAVVKLKQVLNNDSFHGVRTKASEALRSIHSDEALEALIASTKQSDARVRSQVVGDINSFFQPMAFEAAKKTITTEKNPAIQALAIRALGAYGKADVRDTLLKYLNTVTYRERLTQAAISAMRAQDDAAYITPITDALTKRVADLPSYVFASGLDTLAYLARNQDNKDAVRDFIVGYVNHPKDAIQLAAISSLGTLEDPKAIAVLEKFATASKDSPERQAAEKAIATLNGAKKPGDNLRDLRNEVMELQKNDRDLRKQLDDLKKKLEAKDAPPASAKKKK